MRILLVGAGGVGSAAVAIAARRSFFETMVVADYDLAARRGRSPATAPGSSPPSVDASSADAVAALCREHRITHVLNAVDPRFVMPIFDGALRRRGRLPGHGDVAVPSAPRPRPTPRPG